MGKSPRGPKAGTVRLTFTPGGPVEADRDETVLNAAWRAGVPVVSPCGGQGLCGRCLVRMEPAPPLSEEDFVLLTGRDREAGWRLACRARAQRETRVTLPRRGGAAAGVPVLVGPSLTRGGGRRGGRKRFGAAVDLGTTTLAAQLWDISDRKLLDTATAPNPQAPWGADILSRISASAGTEERSRLRDALRRGVEDLVLGLADRAGLKPPELGEICVAGNTAMQHFLTGRDPQPLSRAPFRPVFLAPPPLTGRALGLKFLHRAVVRLVPCASAFVGGDAVAGVVALLAAGRKAPSLLVDMGTNAELVLLRPRSVLATSAAAGPALEGGSISCGMAAVPGAVEEVEFAGDLRLKVLGGGEARGLCGSGLIDAAALLLRFGLLLPDGRLQPPESAARSPWKRLAARLQRDGSLLSFRIREATGSSPPLTLTQKDIRELQLAAAAVATAWQLLLRQARLRASDVQTVYMAGGFGYSLRPESLSTLGLISPLWKTRVAVVGNSSLAGASLCLLDRTSAERAGRIAATMKTFHLAGTRDFQRHFIHNLTFPEPR